MMRQQTKNIGSWRIKIPRKKIKLAQKIDC